MMGAAVAAAFLGLLAWAAWSDIRDYRIPNALVGALLVLFVLALASGLVPRNNIPTHLATGALALLLGLALFHVNWIGGGDAKLFAVLALWAGGPEVIRLAFVMALVGGALSALILLRARFDASKKAPPASAATGEGNPVPKVPYGVAIAVAGLDYWVRALAAPFLLSGDRL
jgi:prepilin peptidase CpaA